MCLYGRLISRTAPADYGKERSLRSTLIYGDFTLCKGWHHLCRAIVEYLWNNITPISVSI